MIDSFIHDVRYAVRALGKSPGFAVVPDHRRALVQPRVAIRYG
jgi:allophanate hydrolase subunit 1